MNPEKKNDIIDAVGMLCVIEDEVDVNSDQEPKSYVGVNSFGFQAAVSFFKTKLKNLSIMWRFARARRVNRGFSLCSLLALCEIQNVFSEMSTENHRKL